MFTVCLLNSCIKTMERWRGRVALVTGASVGIGADIAKTLVKRGLKVVGCSRNIERITALSEELRDQPGSLTAIACDVSQEDQVLAMFDQIRNDPKLGRIDICINNAGLAHEAPLLTGETSQWKHIFEVNVIGLLMCTREAFKLMKEKDIDDGHIILMNSLRGIRPVKDRNGHCYMAAKFAVNAIREGIRNELRELNSHIRISQICPTSVETEFAERFTNKERAKAKHSKLKCLQADDITEAVLYILSAPCHVEVNDIVIRPTEQDFQSATSSGQI